MYKISLKNDKPDIEFMRNTMTSLMERGIRLADCKELYEYYSNLREYLKSEKINNPNSPAQIVNYLEKLASQFELQSRNDIINICYDAATDKWTTNADALGKLADMGYDFARDLLEYRHVKKYAESVESLVHSADGNGLVHPTVTLGKTNRVNYSEPGLLTIPKKLLWSVIAPYKPCNILYSVDIKNQEPNILINMTSADELKQALESPDGLYETMFKQCFMPKATANILYYALDECRQYYPNELKDNKFIPPAIYKAVHPYAVNVLYKGEKVAYIETVCIGAEPGKMPSLPSEVSIEMENGEIHKIPVTWDMAEVSKRYKKDSDSVSGVLQGLEVAVTKAERKEFKTAWLAISYGSSNMGIRNACKLIDGNEVYNYITKIKELKEYRGRVDKLARSGQSKINTAFGTQLDAGSYYGDWKKLKRVLLDLPIQGTGADILSLLIKRFYDYKKEAGIHDCMSLYYTRHDELIIEVDNQWFNNVGKEKVESVLRDMLEHQIDDWTPFQVEIGIVSQDEKNKVDLEDDE